MIESLRRSRAEVKGRYFTVSGSMFVARQGVADFFSNQSPLESTMVDYSDDADSTHESDCSSLTVSCLKAPSSF
jgi:hypothetical protein